jgi:uncharacterized membrane protein
MMAGIRKPSLSTILVICILVLGTGIRLYHLGQVSLWFDEAGVVMAAISPTVQDTMTVAQQHMAAMPLDYLVARVMAHFSLAEGWMRLPSALWGSLSLLVFYALTARLINRQAGVIAMLLLALSQIHIQYSQELRFYATGVFFYLLATLLVWEGLQTDKALCWAGLVLFTTIGEYFYLYVLFALINGGAWLILVYWRQPQRWKLLKHFMICVIVILILSLPGYLFFGVEPRGNYSPDFNQVGFALTRGFSWIPSVVGAFNIGWLWGGVIFLLELAGCWIILRGRDRHLLAVLFSIAIQAVFICTADFYLITGHFNK